MENLSPMLQATINKRNDANLASNVLEASSNTQTYVKNPVIEDKFTPNTRFTKKGNHYEKTNIGKVIGTLGGAIYGAIQSSTIIKEFKKINVAEILRNTMNFTAETLSFKISPEEIEKAVSVITKQLPRVTAAAVLLGATLIGLGIGSIVNFVINKIKAHNADKAAQEK